MINYLKRCTQSKKWQHEILFALLWATIILVGSWLLKGDGDAVATLFLMVTTVGWVLTRNFLPEK